MSAPSPESTARGAATPQCASRHINGRTKSADGILLDRPGGPAPGSGAICAECVESFQKPGQGRLGTIEFRSAISSKAPPFPPPTGQESFGSAPRIAGGGDRYM